MSNRYDDGGFRSAYLNSYELYDDGSRSPWMGRQAFWDRGHGYRVPSERWGVERNGYEREESPYAASPSTMAPWPEYAGWPDGPFVGRGPKGYKRSDERIREDVCDAIARQGFIDASDVEVFTDAGVVRLVGTVALRRDKRGLEHIIERVAGVDEIRNELRVSARDVGSDRYASRTDRHVTSSHNGKNARA